MKKSSGGGDPRKNLEARNYSGQINPRASFETWSEELKLTSHPWSKAEINGAPLLRNLVFHGLIQKDQLLSELLDQVKKYKSK